MLPLTKALQPQIKMKLTISAVLIGRFSAVASFSSSSSAASSLVEDKIWLMLPSHEAKDPPLEKKINDDQQGGKVRVHKWHDSCFYDIGKKSFITSSNQQKNFDDEVPKIVGSSHGYLALLKPSDCSLSLVKVPPRFSASTRSNYEGHIRLPGMDTLHHFTGKVFRQSEFNHEFGEYSVTGFACRGEEDHEETIETCKRVSEYFVEKIVMSSVDDSPTVVMSTHSPETKLAFCRGFDAKKWTELHSVCCFSDVIYSTRDQKFYGIQNSYDLKIGIWDLKGRIPKAEFIDLRPHRAQFFKLGFYKTFRHQNRLSRYYLVESLGEVLLVARHFGYHVAEDGTCLSCIQDQKSELPYRTIDFDVFKIDPSRERLHSVKCLGDQALFLGINHSFAVSAKEVPGIEGNCIYFGDHYMMNHAHFRGFKDYAFGGHDFGIFNVEDKSLSACYPTDSMKFVSPPVWIAPTSHQTRI